MTSAAGDVLWKENVSGDWKDATRWEGGVVPTATDTAALTKSGSNYCVNVYTTPDAIPAALNLWNFEKGFTNTATLASRIDFSPAQITLKTGGVLRVTTESGRLYMTNKAFTATGGEIDVGSGSRLVATKLIKLQYGAALNQTGSIFCLTNSSANAFQLVSDSSWTLSSATGILVCTHKNTNSLLSAKTGSRIEATGESYVRSCDSNTIFKLEGGTMRFADTSRLVAQQPLFGAAKDTVSEAEFADEAVLEIVGESPKLTVAGTGKAQLTLNTPLTTDVSNGLFAGYNGQGTVVLRGDHHLTTLAATSHVGCVEKVGVRDSTVNAVGTMRVENGRWDTHGLYVGASLRSSKSSEGTLTISTQGVVTNRAEGLMVGDGAKTMGTIAVAGGALYNASDAATSVGVRKGNGILRVSDGGRAVFAGDLAVGDAANVSTTGRVCVTSGTLTTAGDVRVATPSKGLGEIEIGPDVSARLIAKNLTLSDNSSGGAQIVRFVFGPEGTGTVICGTETEATGKLTIGSNTVLEFDLGSDVAHPRAWNLLFTYDTIEGDFADVKVVGGLAEPGKLVKGEHDGVTGLWYCFPRGTAAVFR